MIRTVADRVAVITVGRIAIVEIGELDEGSDAPKAQYARPLLATTPSIEAALAAGAGGGR